MSFSDGFSFSKWIKGSIVFSAILISCFLKKPSAGEMLLFALVAGFGIMSLMSGGYEKCAGPENEVKPVKSPAASGDKLLEEFAAWAAHDYNNIFTSISGYLVLMKELRPDDDELQEFLRRTAAAVRAGTRLSDEISCFSPAASMKPDCLDTSGVIRSLAEIVSGECRRRNIELQIQEGGESLIFKATGRRLLSCLTNLVLNSCEAIGKDGKIILAAGRIGEKEIYISVEDDGPGIPGDNKEKIFEPFFSTKQGNSGIGLYGVSKCISRMNGKIKLDSSPGRTVFSFIFPSA
ncbi:MAG: sensor histidine kinase [Fibrobacterota bacterium]